ncbi:MAG: ankyrin repeat domain-containing protein [Alphaproteobacteria bacterium]|nr:ankyrin repeat domain-containing protein [Alphaproteobacteria bacterium]
MIESGADLSQTISGKVTALMLAAETGNTEVARCLLEHGAKPNTQDSYGFTALMYTTLITRGEFTDTALTLLEHGADASTQSNGGETALMYAILNGHERLAKILIAHNADTTPIMKTNYWGLKGKTAGEIAEKAGRTKLASTIHTEYIKSTFRAAAEQGTTRPRKVRRARPSAVR